jgi:small subunit ribosomal protein S1
MQNTHTSNFAKLIEDGSYLNIPQVGDVVSGKVIGTGRKEVRIDIEGLTTGVVRGRELFSESTEYANIAPGETVEATLIDLENENGEMELSFRFAGQQKAWGELRRMHTSGQAVEVKILEANKGGLIVRLEHITGFLPVSQLSPEHYPRVTGGDKQKILEKLKSYVGINMRVRVLDIHEDEEKLIVSEKAVWEDEQKNVLSQYKVGDKVKGDITALADFGAFVKFDSLEGLVHISEIAWQRIDHPRDILTIGQTVEAEIIGLEGSKIFLSMKKLIGDPWSDVEQKYKIGDKVKGTVLKVNPFGFFVELDDEIHGLAHVSELSDKPIADINAIGKEGDVLEFRIVSIEPKEHRLGLSMMEESQEESKPETVETEPVTPWSDENTSETQDETPNTEQTPDSSQNT